METIEKHKSEIMQIIAGIRIVSERIKVLHKAGYLVNEYSMGSGGVGQVVEMSDHYRVQIGYGHGRHNYAYAVRIDKTA